MNKVLLMSLIPMLILVAYRIILLTKLKIARNRLNIKSHQIYLKRIFPLNLKNKIYKIIIATIEIINKTKLVGLKHFLKASFNIINLSKEKNLYENIYFKLISNFL